MTKETVIQVAPDSTGKKVRNFQATVGQDDQSTADVLQQVVSVAGKDGTPVDFDALGRLEVLMRKQLAVGLLLLNLISPTPVSEDDVAALANDL